MVTLKNTGSAVFGLHTAIVNENDSRLMTAVPALQQNRHRQVLAEVVRAYIETGEPVSSRTIVRMHAEPLSSATIRNIMADLEDEGLLYQPHTSAGRVPTASAYRFYVEQIAAQA